MSEGIMSGTKRIAEIVKGLRDFSRTDATHLTFDDLHQNINNTLVILSSRYKDRIQIVKQFDESIEAVQCYPGQLSQAFMNLISNGIDAIEGEGSIRITTERKGDKVKIAIHDSGSGIPSEIRSRIFDPFFTTKPVGKGTGLGLSITYGIIEKHQGRIEVHSEPHKGTTFTIHLPMMQ
jgi:signal transduction histidine kinase